VASLKQLRPAQTDNGAPLARDIFESRKLPAVGRGGNSIVQDGV
jgi:hypothetical protein